MPIKAERLEADVVVNTGKAEKDLDSFQRKMKQTGDTTTQTGKTAEKSGKSFLGLGGHVKTMMAGFGVASAVKFGASITQAASEAQQSVGGTEAVFGKFSDTVMADSKDAAKQFGLSANNYRESANIIGSLLKNQGVAAKQLGGQTKSMVSLGADLSATYGGTVKDAVGALASAYKGEFDPMQQYGVTLTQNAINLEAMRQAGVKTTADFNKLSTAQQTSAKRAATTALVMKQSTSAQGQFQKQTNTLAEQQQILGAQFTDLKATLGNALLPVLTQVLTAVNKHMIPAFEAVPKVVGKVKHAITDVTDAVPGMNKGLKIAAGVVTGVFVGAMVVAATRATITKTKVVASWIAQQAAAVKSALIQARALVSTGVFYVQYAALVAAQGAKAAASWIAQQARMVASTVASGARVVATWIAQAAVATATMAATVARVVAGWVLMAVQSTIQAARMAAAWIIAMGPIALAVAAVVAVVALIIKNWSKITAATKAAWSAVSGAISKAWDFIKRIVSGAVGALVGAVTGAMGKVRSVFSGAWNAITGLVGGAMGKVASAVSSGVGRVVGVVKTLPGKIVGGLGNVGGMLLHSGEAIIQGLIDGIGNMAGKVYGAVKGVLSKARNLLPFSPAKEGPFSGKGWTLHSGRSLMEGFAQGITDRGRKVVQATKNVLSAQATTMAKSITKVQGLKRPKKRDAAQDDLAKTLTKGFTDAIHKGHTAAIQRYVGDLVDASRKALEGKAEQTLVSGIKRLGKAATAELKRQSTVASRLAAAISSRDAQVQAKSSFQDSMASGISNQANVLNSGNSASAIRASLQVQVAKANAYVANLKRLRAMGYASAVIQQVASAGIEQGAAVAEALAKASPDDVAGISSAFTKITATAATESKSMAGSLYNAGIQAANGMIEGLKSRQEAIGHTLTSIAKSMATSIKKALKIKSPSRVMIDLMGYVGAGMVKGLQAMHRPVAKAGAGIATVASSSIAGALGSTPGLPGAPGGSGGPITPGATGGLGGNRTVQFNFTVHNPKDEATSQTTNKALDRVASLGLV